MLPDSLLEVTLTSLTPEDLTAVVVFILIAAGYRLFLLLMHRHCAHRLTLGILQEYRTSWIEINGNNRNSIVVVQTLRNSLMTASFFATTAILLIGGALHLFNAVFPEVSTDLNRHSTLGLHGIQTIKLLLIIIALSYSFLHFTWYIRDINNLAYMLTIPFEVIEQRVGNRAHLHLAGLMEQAGFRYSLGMRGYYFTIALFLWFFSNTLLYFSLFLILLSLLLRDFSFSRPDRCRANTISSE